MCACAAAASIPGWYLFCLELLIVWRLFEVIRYISGAAEPVRLVRFWPDHISVIK